jgi:hypothetical protein
MHSKLLCFRKRSISTGLTWCRLLSEIEWSVFTPDADGWLLTIKFQLQTKEFGSPKFYFFITYIIVNWLVWIRIGADGELLWIRYWTFEFHKLLINYRLSKQLGMSRVVLSSMELVSYIIVNWSVNCIKWLQVLFGEHVGAKRSYFWYLSLILVGVSAFGSDWFAMDRISSYHTFSGRIFSHVRDALWFSLWVVYNRKANSVAPIFLTQQSPLGTKMWLMIEQCN